MERFTVQILLTKEEHIQSVAAVRQEWSVWCGFGLVVCAATARCFLDIPVTAVWGLITLALFCVLYEHLFLPMHARVNAAAEYARRQELRQTVTATFSQDGIEVESARVSGTLTYDLCRAVETPQLLVLYFGAEWILRIPKRLLTDTQLAALRARL